MKQVNTYYPQEVKHSTNTETKGLQKLSMSVEEWRWGGWGKGSVSKGFTGKAYGHEFKSLAPT